MINPNPMHMVNSFDHSRSGELSEPTRRLLERRDRVLGAPYRLFYERPVAFTRGEGVLLYDSEGRDYLDAYNNVPVVGHGNTRVKAAVASQLGTLNTHTRYLTEGIIDYAERLTALLPHQLDQVVFACTGSEAVDLALRIARHYTGGQGVIVTSHAYHGTTQAAAEISPALGPNNPIPSTVIPVPAPDVLREDAESAAAVFEERVRGAIEDFTRRGIRFAGMIVDSVLSSDGLQLDPAGFLSGALRQVREAGGIYIADEVQSGFGRIGAAWWGFERHGVQPELVVLGKPMGNGMPVSAVVGREDLLGRFGRDVRYFNTFGGSGAGIAAASSVLDVIEEEDLLANALTTGEYLREELKRITSGIDGVAAVRGAGLFLGVEFVADKTSLVPDAATALAFVNRMRERRVLVSASGGYGNVIKIRPPLVFGRSHANRFLTEFEATLGDTYPA